MLIVSCLEWLTCIFLFKMVEFKSFFNYYYYYFIFLLYKALLQHINVYILLKKNTDLLLYSPKTPFPSLSNACHAGYSHMRFYVTQWSATRFYGSLSVYRLSLQPWVSWSTAGASRDPRLETKPRVCTAAPSPQKKSPLGSPVKKKKTKKRAAFLCKHWWLPYKETRR